MTLRAAVISGPTAGGKSLLALTVARLAETRKKPAVEIVSADSVQVYAGFDIGSSKSSAAERAAVPHHLVDIRDPKLGPAARYTAAEFLSDAVRTIGEVRGRGHTPLVVGGSGLYLRALLKGLSGAPPVPEDVQAALEQEADERGLPALRAELETQDPVTAGIVKPGDRRRILRAIGVFRVTGRPLGDWNREHGFRARPVEARVFVLSPPREELRRRIAVRTREMLERGLVSEVKNLLASGVPQDAPPFEAIGYKQVLKHLAEGAFRGPGELEAEITLRTQQYAKQQVTWWRSETGVEWVDPAAVSLEALAERIPA